MAKKDIKPAALKSLKDISPFKINSLLVKQAGLTSKYSGGDSYTGYGEIDIDKMFDPMKKILAGKMKKKEKKDKKKKGSGSGQRVDIYHHSGTSGTAPPSEKEETVLPVTPVVPGGDPTVTEEKDTSGGDPTEKCTCEGLEELDATDPECKCEESKGTDTEQTECEKKKAECDIAGGDLWYEEKCACVTKENSEKMTAIQKCIKGGGTWNQKCQCCDNPGEDPCCDDTETDTTPPEKEFKREECDCDDGQKGWTNREGGCDCPTAVVGEEEETEETYDPKEARRNIEQNYAGVNYGFPIGEEHKSEEDVTHQHPNPKRSEQTGSTTTYITQPAENTIGVKRNVVVLNDRVSKSLGKNVTVYDNFKVENGTVSRSGERIVKYKKGKKTKYKLEKYSSGAGSVARDMDLLYGFYQDDERSAETYGLNKYQDVAHKGITINGKPANVQAIYQNDKKLLNQFGKKSSSLWITGMSKELVAEKITDEQKEVLKIWYDEYNQHGYNAKSTRGKNMKKLYNAAAFIFNPPTKFTSPIKSLASAPKFRSPFPQRDRSHINIRKKWKPTKQQPMMYRSPLHQDMEMDPTVQTPEEMAGIEGQEMQPQTETIWDKMSMYGDGLKTQVDKFVSNAAYNPEIDKPIKAIQNQEWVGRITEWLKEKKDLLVQAKKSKDKKSEQEINQHVQSLIGDITTYAGKFQGWIDRNGGDQTPGNKGGNMTSEGSSKDKRFEGDLAFVGDTNTDMDITDEGKIGIKSYGLDDLKYVEELDADVFMKDFKGYQQMLEMSAQLQEDAESGRPMNKNIIGGQADLLLANKDSLLSWAHDPLYGQAWIQDFAQANPDENLDWAMPESEQFDRDRLEDEVHGWLTDKLTQAYVKYAPKDVKDAEEIKNETMTNIEQGGYSKNTPMAFKQNKTRAQQLIAKYS